MQKYFDNVTNRSGDAVVNAQVTVTVTATGSLATIYADNGVTTKSNPMVVDSNGYFEFYAANGRYTLTVTGGALTTRVVQDVLLEDITGTGASLVGFSHSDTNPAGSIGAKAHQVVSVTDAPYSAKGDGVTDDTAAIQAAVNASLVVNFPDTGSTYKTRQVTLRAGSTLRGPGRLSLSSGVCILDVPLGANGVTIDGIGLSFQDATFGQGVIQIGITGSVAGSTTNDVTVRNCSITGKIWARRVLRPVIENNIIVNGGVHFDDWSDQAIVSGNTITQDLTYSNDAIGANNVDAAPAPHGQNVITNNVITTTRMGVEWRDWVVSGTTTNNDVKSIIAGNSIRTIGTDVSAFGISLNSDGWSISNNTINHDGAITSGTFGMEIVQSSYNTIVGNRVSGFSSGITVYSTTATNPAKGNVVADNTIRGCSFGIGVWRHTRDTRVHGNYVEFATGASARYAFQIDGDSTATDGTLGTHGERAIVTGNTVVADTSADANSYSYMYFAHMLDSICKDNTVLMASGNAFSRGIFVIDCDSLSVEGNKLARHINRSRWPDGLD